MHEPLLPPSDSAATQQQYRRKPITSIKQKTSKKLDFSKKLTIIDISCWVIITLLILIIMLVEPVLAEPCINIFGGSTAAYVSLRLGYTAKAGVENYKKISQSYLQNHTDDLYYFNDDCTNG